MWEIATGAISQLSTAQNVKMPIYIDYWKDDPLFFDIIIWAGVKEGGKASCCDNSEGLVPIKAIVKFVSIAIKQWLSAVLKCQQITNVALPLNNSL